ncbi:TPA: hypothetical protein ACN36G_004433 [Vibrio parahaemolyticus]|uniref:hypothetical protein n=1 Tax=Vibrio parahaemolyticus TaxID=670 RepID=UPI0004DB5A39|nr:hypothetical protein [Vibrio parahaemolyticus]MDF4642602.1 hypothetical protein [Vibrio parahaemolyticus]
MKTNFNFKLNDLMRISGSASSDLQFADKCTKEMLEFVQDQVGIVDEFVELTKVMSSNSKKVLEDCLIAINHIYSVLQELKEFFKLSPICDPFDITHYKVEQLKADAEKKVKKLLPYIQVI